MLQARAILGKVFMYKGLHFLYTKHAGIYLGEKG